MNEKVKTGSVFLLLLGAFIVGPESARAQDCMGPVIGAPQDCGGPVVVPVTAANGPSEGFLFSIDGVPAIGDEALAGFERRSDVVLADVDIQVKFDGLGAEPRLDALVLGAAPRRPGDPVTFQSRLNYPAYVERGEIRIIDIRARGGERVVAVLPIDLNGQVTTLLPEGEGLVYVHRVYDRNGRFDETLALSLGPSDAASPELADLREDGTDATGSRNIAVHGGSVTVFGEGLAPGASVAALGETVAPDGSGRFVLQRILPPGLHAVNVYVSDAGRSLTLTREVTVPKSDWFYTGTVDLTFGKRIADGKYSLGGSQDDYYSRGRIALYADGRTQGGFEITASVDTGEENLSDIFRRLDEKDPRSVLWRIDPNSLYPTYGDDSTSVDDTPTSGKFFLRVKQGGNIFQWGDFRTKMEGSSYLRNPRQLYGAQLYLETEALTSNGNPRLRFEAYGAQPDSLPERDVFRGTGGSVYFLSRQDVAIGSETLTIEIRDSINGRVRDRRTLIYGTDYDINYFQGIVTLSRPLSSYGGAGPLVTTSPSGDASVVLVAQYEWTPSSTDVDGFSYGGRVEGWATDSLRIGATARLDETGGADQEAYGGDLLWNIGENSWIELEFARTDGPGFGSSYSTDGGLITDTTSPVGGTGEAFRFESRLDLADLGARVEGFISSYYENRTAGFSTLDYQMTRDAELWGIYGEISPVERTKFRFFYDVYSEDGANTDKEGGIEVAYELRADVLLEFGIEHLDRKARGDPSETGQRTDIGMRVTFSPREDLDWYLFGVTTVDRAGGLDPNDRGGAGIRTRLWSNWFFEGELSGGTTGLGTRMLLTYDSNETDSYYFGYTLDPDRSISGASPSGRDKGQVVAGGRRQINESVATFGENSYDLFGERRSLASTYGVDYTPNANLTFSTALEIGEVQDPINGDFERQALSFGVRYEDEVLTTKGRLEYRRERGDTSGTNRDADSIFATGTFRYRFSDNARLVGAVDLAITDTNQAVFLDGEYAEVSLGYAFRPVNNDKLNFLFKYRYLYDLYGQSIDGTDARGPKQRSHVLSFDGIYDVSRRWSVGGKFGARWSSSAPTGTSDFEDNDALLGILNVNWHVVREWDLLLEARALHAVQAATTEYGMLGAVYRHVGDNFKIGLGYNFGRFSDDLTDLTFDDKGLFVNVIAKF